MNGLNNGGEIMDYKLSGLGKRSILKECLELRSKIDNDDLYKHLMEIEYIIETLPEIIEE